MNSDWFNTRNHIYMHKWVYMLDWIIEELKEKREFISKERIIDQNLSTEELINILVDRLPVLTVEWIDYLDIITSLFVLNNRYKLFLCHISVYLKKIMSTYGMPLAKRYYLADPSDYEKLILLRDWSFRNFIQNAPKRSRG